MKKILYLIALSLAAGLMPSGCKMMEDDLFDTDPATRTDNSMAEYRRVFNNNRYGWAMYVSTPTYGRHPMVGVYAVRFDSQFCTFYKSATTQSIPNMAGVDSVVSTYSFKVDNGIVLSFDTYNDFFHYGADQSEYFSQDLQGDFEFCLDRFSENEDTIFAHTKTKGLPVLLLKMDMPAEDYQRVSDEISKYSAYNCISIIGSDTISTRFLEGYRNLVLMYPDKEGGPDVEHMYSYGNLTNGIYMMEPIQYKGVTIRDFALDRETGIYTNDETGAVIKGKPLADYLYNSTDYDNWFFGYSGLGPYTAAEWDLAKADMEASPNLSPSNMANINFMPYGNGTMDLVFNIWYGDGEIHYPMQLRKDADDLLSVKWTGEENSGLPFKYYDNGCKRIVDAFARTDKWTSYKISFREGNSMNPVGFELTDTENPGNSYYIENNFRYYHSSIWE